MSNSTRKTPAKKAAVKKITIADIAREANVSIGLVSSFLTGKDYATDGKSGIRIGSATAQRIREVCREMDYRPDRPSAFNRIYPDRGEVALAGSTRLSFHVNRFYSMILDGVVEGCSKDNVKVSVVQFDPEIDYEKNPELLPRGVQEGDITKFVLVGNPNLSFVRSLLARDIRVVYLSRYVNLPGVISIVPDYAEAASIAVHYLASLGHQRIGFVALDYFKDAWHGAELQRGALSALQALGIDASPADFHFASPSLDEVVRTLMRPSSSRPTALFAFDDLSADYAIRTLTELDLRVPTQVSVIGCNDDRQSGQSALPLSTIHLPVTEMGARAVHEVNQIALHGAPDHPTKIVLPVFLVQRATSGPPPS